MDKADAKTGGAASVAGGLLKKSKNKILLSSSFASKFLCYTISKYKQKLVLPFVFFALIESPL